jgi:hypothetical protein
MRIFFFLLFILSLPTWAETHIISRVQDIDFGKAPDEEVLVFLETGHVAKVKDWKIIAPLSKSNKFEDWWKITLDKKRHIINLEPTVSPQTEGIQTSLIKLQNPYEPTVLQSTNLSKKYFNESRFSRGESQCYNRAHIWSYELWKKHGVKSMKIFLFFSRKYIRAYNFEWWFHVAPMVIAKDWFATTEQVLDPRFIRSPRDVNWWTGKFVHSGTPCKVITKYSEYADFPYSQDCYVLKASMYTYQPLDLERLEVWGTQKNNFTSLDLTWAYRDGFNIEYHGEEL